MLDVRVNSHVFYRVATGHHQSAGRLAFFFLAAALAPPPAGAQQRPNDLLKGRRLGDRARLVGEPKEIARSLFSADHDPWRPAVNDEKPRGAAEVNVYQKFAPAVVVVATPNATGTGFVIDRGGWIVTNNHVIDDAAVDAKSGARVPKVYFGGIDDEGFMQLDKEPIPAPVYRADPDRDLALLKIGEMTGAAKSAPSLRLASESPKVGEDAIVIGHPSSGMLWTQRRGQVAGAGWFPRDISADLKRELIAIASDREPLREALDAEDTCRMILFSAALNPGNSGSPVLNQKGEVLAVVFAIPSKQQDDKFSYCVHLDELRTFMHERPSQPPLYVPDPWPAAINGRFMDLDGDDIFDTLLLGGAPGEPATAILFDLDQDSESPEEVPADRLRQVWDFEAAIHGGDREVAFYDTDDDGEIDRIFLSSDGNGAVNAVLTREADEWHCAEAEADQALIAPEVLRDGAMRKRFIAALTALAKKVPANE